MIDKDEREDTRVKDIHIPSRHCAQNDVVRLYSV